MNPIKVGLLGIGTVGSGTFQVLRRNQAEIRGRAGRGIEIAMVADLDVERARSIVGDACTVVSDAREVIANPEIDIVVELIGGYGIARTLVLDAIKAGKHVVTANKALLARRGEDLVAVQRQQGLVGGDHVLAVGDRLEHQLARQLVAADQLDDDVDIGVVDHREGVAHHLDGVPGQLACPFNIARRHHANFDAAAGTAADLFLVALKNVKGAGTDSAEPQ